MSRYCYESGPFELFTSEDDASEHKIDRDCACPALASYTAPTYDVPSERPLLPHPDLQYIDLHSGYRLIFVPSLSRVAVLNAATYSLFERLKNAQAIHTLQDHEYDIAHCLATQGFFHQPDATKFLGAPSNELVAWLHISNACNLCCSYCYVNQTSTMMNNDTGFATVHAVLRSSQWHDYKRIVLKYAGGEPLLNLALIEQIHPYAKYQADQVGLTLDGVVLSNGTLLDDKRVQLLATLGLRLAVSLDGIGDVHNAQRQTHQGTGSWNRAWSGIQRAQAAGVQVTVSITVSGATIGGLPALVALLRDKDIPFTINFYRENRYSQDNTLLRLNQHAMIDGMRAAYRVIENNLPSYNLLGCLLDRTHAGSVHHYPCGVGKNYLVVDQNGEVAKCHMDMDQQVATVWDSDPLQSVQQDNHGIQNPSVEQKEECRTCPWRFWCAGGCSLAAYRLTGQYDGVSPLCDVYKALLPDVLRLEGLRLLLE